MMLVDFCAVEPSVKIAMRVLPLALIAFELFWNAAQSEFIYLTDNDVAPRETRRTVRKPIMIYENALLHVVPS
jgi:hypothetical protein